jgi:glutathione S-transferase
MALIIAEIAVEHREIELRDKPAALIALSPKATVPVLLLSDGRVLDESLDIMRWALGVRNPLGWGGPDSALIETNDGPFKFHLDRMKYAHRYDGADPAQHRASAIELLQPLEARLAATAYLCGEAPAFTDYAIFPFIRQFARADPEAWQAESLPGLQRWLSVLVSSILFEKAMAKHPVWTADTGNSKEAA